MKNKALIAVLVATMSISSFAAEIDIPKRTQLRLGHGVDVDIEKLFEECIDSDKKEVPEDSRNSDVPHSTHYVNVSTEFITSSRQLDEFTKSDVSVGIQYMAFGASGSNASSSQDSLSSDQLAIGIRAVADYGRWYLPSANLKPKMAALANDKNTLDEFYRRCGHEYVAGYRRGQGLTLVIKTFSQNSFSARSVSTSIGGSAGFGPFSGNVGAAFTSAASELLKYGSLQVDLTVFGGGPLKDNATIITTKKDIEEFAKKIESLVAALDPKDSTPISYITEEYPIGQPNYSPIIADHKRNALWNMYSDYRKIRNDLNRLKEIVRSDFARQYRELCNVQSEMSCTDYAEYLKKLIAESQNAIADINQAAVRCAKSQDVRDCDTTPIMTANPELAVEIVWPKQYRHQLYEAKVRAIGRQKISGHRQ